MPGDLSSATEIRTGESNITVPGTGALVINSGRVVTAPDGTIEFEAGRIDFDDFAGAIDRICQALGG